MLKVESVDLQPLVALLLELLREANRQAGRSAGEQPFDDYARRHAGQETIKRIDANATDERIASSYGSRFPVPRLVLSLASTQQNQTRNWEPWNPEPTKKNGGGRRRSATPPNDSPTGAELD